MSLFCVLVRGARRVLLLAVMAHTAFGRRVRSLGVRRTTADAGQTTAEYALVLVGAVAVALLLIAWVTGSGKIGELFDAVFDHIVSKVQ